MLRCYINQKGFSLIELTMVIFIIGVASTIVAVQYSGSRNSKALYLGSKQVANDIRMTQNYTFSALGDGGANPSGGYGVRFSKDSNSYLIFADEDSNRVRTDNSEDFQTINLPDGVEVKSLKIDTASADPVDVVFTSPYGEIYINGNNKNAGNFIDLEIEIGNSSGTRVVKISTSRKIN